MTSIIKIYRRFPTQDDCLKHLEKVRWDGDPSCPHCGADTVCEKTEQDRRSRLQCWSCKKSFSVTVGTIFHNSHIDLQRWFLLISLMFSAKKGLSAMQAARDLEMRRPTVWSMRKKIEQHRKDKFMTSLAKTLDTENWKPIAGYEGLYEISDMGNVRSIRRNLIKSPAANDRGYFHVGLHNGAKQERLYVHRLVLETFIGPCPGAVDGCHNDGNRANNRLDNLRWDTPMNNHADRLTHGTDTRGEKNGLAKLSKGQVLHIRKSSDRSLAQLAMQFGVSKATIADIKAGRTWAHI